jgi:hypothetical protein
MRTSFEGTQTILEFQDGRPHAQAYKTPIPLSESNQLTITARYKAQQYSARDKTGELVSRPQVFSQPEEKNWS